MPSPTQMLNLIQKLLKAKVGDKVEGAMPGQTIPATPSGPPPISTPSTVPPVVGRKMGEPSTGPGPSVVDEKSLSAVDAPHERNVFGKKFIEGIYDKEGNLLARGLEDELNAMQLEKPFLNRAQLEEEAIEQVKRNFEALDKGKKSFADREARGVGRREYGHPTEPGPRKKERIAEMNRGEKLPRGNRPIIDDPIDNPTVDVFPENKRLTPNEAGIGQGTPQPPVRTLQLRARNQGKDELTDSAFADSAANRPVDPKELGFYNEATVTELDVLPRQTKLEQKIINDVREKIGSMDKTLGPEFQERYALDLVREGLKKIKTDESAKQLFDILDQLGTPKHRGPLDISTKGMSDAEKLVLNESKRKKVNFRREAAQAAEKAREDLNPQPLKDLTNRITAPLSKTAKTRQKSDTLTRLQKQLKLRLEANRKTNKPRSTSRLEEMIRELQGRRNADQMNKKTDSLKKKLK